jgi:hypothetical protein
MPARVDSLGKAAAVDVLHHGNHVTTTGATTVEKLLAGVDAEPISVAFIRRGQCLP